MRSQRIAGHLGESGSTNTASSVKSIPTQVYSSTRRCEARHRVETETVRKGKGCPLGGWAQTCACARHVLYSINAARQCQWKSVTANSADLVPRNYAPQPALNPVPPHSHNGNSGRFGTSFFYSNRNDFIKRLKRYALNYGDLFS